MNSTTILLFVDGEPVYQPFADRGLKYHPPYSRSDSTYWVRDGSSKRLTSRQVAAEVGVELGDLLKWENARDLEEEADARSNDDGW